MRITRTVVTLAVAAGLVAGACGGGGATASPTPAPKTSAPVAATSTPAPTWNPTKDVELVVQAAAGGGSDIFARKIADVLTKEKLSAKPINVVNKPGGSGAVAYAYIKQKQADPHFIATVTLSYLTTPLSNTSAGYTYSELSNIAILAVDDFVAVVKDDASYKTLKDIVDAAKSKGPKQIKVGGTQVGSSDSIIPALIEQATGVQFNYITFQSGGEVNAALLGGTVDFAIANPAEALSLVQGKKLRAVASFSPEPLKGWTATTAKSQGIDVIWEQFRGITAPGGLKEIEQKYWADALEKMTKTADWAKYLDDNTLRPVFKKGADAKKYLDDQNTMLKTVLTKLGVIK
ncbi:MAG TPA: tripartite tricarboxylate transporter substrate binding protein [Candidatus Limnocylindria bacterium]|nr:tripartite tricarboxylate transporter substrate binding protein [Candidatus Limnocylindria bacterium]